MPAKEVRAQFPHMGRRALSLADAMCPTRIGHEAELTAVADEFVDQHLGILIVNVIIRRTMDIQQISAQMTCMRDR